MNTDIPLLVNFDRVAEHFRGTDDPDFFAARHALKEIYEVYYTTASRDGLANPYYASHGPDHGVYLSGLVAEFLTKEADHDRLPLGELETLVLIFSSCMLHDVGMAIPADGLSITDMHQRQANRKEHDDRSLKFIEKHIIAELDSGPFSSWKAFWEARRLRYESDWDRALPEKPHVHIAFLLARICKSHGDDEKIWLTQQSLDEYTSPVTNKVKQFPNIWGRSWNYYREISLTAATILSLIDLCDIRPNRYIDISEAWRRTAAFPRDKSIQSLSFIHWLSHKVSRVHLTSDAIEIAVGRHDDSLACTLHVLLEGATADCLKWGNKPQLINSVRKYVNPAFKGVRSNLGGSRQESWEHIEQEAQTQTVAKCWSYDHINEKLRLSGFSNFDTKVILPRWWNAIFPLWKEDIKRDNNTEWFYQIGRIRGEGLLIENVIDVDPILNARDKVIVANFFPHLKSSSDNEYIREDCFISAIRIARDLSFLACPSFRSLRYATRGNDVYSWLKSGNFEPLDGSIIIIELPTAYSREAREYAEIANRISRGRSSIALVFFGEALEHFEPVTSVAKMVKATTNIERLNSFNHSQGEVSEEASIEAHTEKRLIFNLEDQPSLEWRFSNAAVWLGMLRRGANNALASLSSALDSKSKGRIALGQLLIISLVDFLNVDYRGLLLDDLRYEYNSVSGTLKHLGLPTFEESARDFPSRLGISLQGREVIITSSNDVSKLRQFLAAKNPAAYLVQAVCLYWLWAHARIYNFSAEPLVGDVPPNNLLESVFRFTLDSSNDLQVRVAVGMRFAFAMAPLITENEDVKGNVLDALAGNINGLLSTLESVIIWQIIYALFQNVAEPPKDLGSYPDIIKIGILEALASNPNIDSMEDEAIRSLVSQCICSFVDKCKAIDNTIAHLEDKTILYAIIAFDIAIHYGSRSLRFLDAMNSLVREGVRLGWRDYAEYIQSGKDKPVGKEAEVLLRAWAEWKQFLYEIIEMTPSEHKRTKIDVGTRERVRSLCSGRS